MTIRTISQTLFRTLCANTLAGLNDYFAELFEESFKSSLKGEVILKDRSTVLTEAVGQKALG